MKYNCHIHPKIYHPKYFAGAITPFIDKNTYKVVKFLDNINPFSDSDIFSRLGEFLEYEDSTDLELIETMMKNEPKTIFCLKIMDLSCMGAGTVKKDIIHQFGELLELKRQGYPILLFPMIDPRNKQIDLIYNIFKSHIDDIQGFAFYPTVGYAMIDERLDRFFNLLNTNNKCAIVHCTDTSPVYYQGKGLCKMLEPLKQYAFYVHSINRKKQCSNFAHPHFTNVRAGQYKNINFSHAHFGGVNRSWRNYIIKGIMSNDNVYTDISYTYIDKNEREEIKKIFTTEIKDKILPGTDWYVYVIEKTLNPYADVPKFLHKNAEKFLRIK